MESHDTSDSNFSMPVRQARGLLEEKRGDVEAFKLTAAL